MKKRGQTIYPIKDRLLSMSKLQPTGCIEWQGSLRNGYGRMIVGSRTDGTRKTVSAHRAAYEAYFGAVPAGMMVCHRCDNPKCINAEHLFLGSRQDNVDDREAKGRNNHKRRLSENEVDFIRSNRGIIRSKELATRFKVSYHTIKHIWIGRYYPAPPKEPHVD